MAAHALALGIERVFLADGPISGWWPDHLRTPPEPLQAFRTLIGRLDGAAGIACLTSGQYRIEIPGHPDRYLLWKSDTASGLPSGLKGRLEVTTALGETHRIDAARLKLTAAPVFVESVGSETQG